MSLRQQTHKHPPYPRTAIIGVVVLLFITVILALGIGAVWVIPTHVIDILGAALHIPGFGHNISNIEQSIIINIRLPRVIMSIMSGSLLAITGVFMQAFFRNPLADPALIGVAAGGALGAVSMIVLGATFFAGLTQLATVFALPIAAFAGSLTVCLIVFSIARRDGMVNMTTMLLCGIAINAMAGAGIGLLSFIADDAQLRDLTFWSLGSLAAASWWQVGTVGIPFLITLAAIPFLRAPLNALLLGDNEALHLGYPVERLKKILLTLTCIAAGAVVATCGVIGFIGLIAPHIARLITGPNHHYVLPLAALIGATLLTAADIVARTIVTPAELPIGVLTALIGGPVFLWLLRQGRGGRFHA